MEDSLFDKAQSPRLFSLAIIRGIVHVGKLAVNKIDLKKKLAMGGNCQRTFYFKAHSVI